MGLKLTKEQEKFMTAWNKKNIKISREVRDIIHGYIMSDGYVKPLGSLTVDQSRKQRKFVEWLHSKLEPLCVNQPGSSNIKDVTRTDERSQKQTYSSRFSTRNVLKGFHKMWYKPCTQKDGKPGFKKQLPKSIHCFFNSTFLAVWFAGDGTKMKNSVGAKYEVTAFEQHERERLKELFQHQFGIKAVINRAGRSGTGTEQWAISINSPEYPKFKALITQIDLIEKLFSYKLHPG